MRREQIFARLEESDDALMLAEIIALAALLRLVDSTDQGTRQMHVY